MENTKQDQPSVNDLFYKYVTVFNGIGKFPTKHHIQVKPEAVLVVRKLDIFRLK